MSPQVVFRTDASNRIGGGHLVRCLSLAEEFASHGWSVTLLTRRETLELFPFVSNVGFLHLQLLDEPDFYPGKNPPADLLIVDHYDLDVRYESSARDFVQKILVIDDLANRRHDCDFLIDQSAGRCREDYEALVPLDAKIFVGPKYGLLRPQFRIRRKHALKKIAEINRVKKILINFGAADGKRMTSFTLRAIAQTGLKAHLDIVVRAGVERSQNLDELCRRTNCSYTFHSDVTDMASLMLKADMAVGAGGTSSLERCCMGLPTVVIGTAENQLVQSKALQALGAQSYLGLWSTITVDILAEEIIYLCSDHDKRISIKKSGMEVCDGHGASRLLSHIMLADKKIT